MHKKFRYIAGIIVILFIVIRLIQLPLWIQFGSDEGRDLLAVWEMYTSGVPKLIGPPSEYSFNGQQFYFGPAPYYIILPALILGNWDPLFVSYFLIFFHAIILSISLWLIGKRVHNTFVLSSFAIFCAFHPAVISYTRSYWNPYFTFPVSLLLLALLLQKKQSVQNTLLYFLGIGFLMGLGMQFHYAFVFTVVVCVSWLAIDKKINRFSYLFLAGGFFVGILPLVLYELLHDFYNIRTFFLVLTHFEQSHTPFILHSFYLISLLPFLFYLLSLAMVRLWNISPPTLSLVYVLGIFWSFLTVFQPHVSLLSYETLQELTTIIVQDRPPPRYNIVDQLTQDNRAMALRYLLAVKGMKPLGVADYAKSEVLYVYTTAPLEVLLTDPVYELQSETKLMRERAWRIENGITVYKLRK